MVEGMDVVAIITAFVGGTDVEEAGTIAGCGAHPEKSKSTSK
jgi:hypothetical protein